MSYYKLSKRCKFTQLSENLVLQFWLLFYFVSNWFEWGSGGQISWDRNSTFSGDWVFDHEVKILFVHEIEFVQ